MFQSENSSQLLIWKVTKESRLTARWKVIKHEKNIKKGTNLIIWLKVPNWVSSSQCLHSKKKLRNLNPTTRVNPGFDKSYPVKGGERGGRGCVKRPRINRLDTPACNLIRTKIHKRFSDSTWRTVVSGFYCFYGYASVNSIYSVLWP